MLKNIKNKTLNVRDNILKAEHKLLLNFVENHKARQALSVIEREKGPLNKHIKQQCNEYAEDYLGNKKYAPLLHVFSAVQGKFKEGWIPYNYYIENFILGLDSTYVSQGNMKAMAPKILDSRQFPDLLYINNGFLIEPSDLKIVDEKQARNLLFNKNEFIVFKSNTSIQGKSVYFYNSQNFNFKEIKGMSGVFQRVISQHKFFDDLLPVPGATIRIVTALGDQGASVRSAYLRLGRLTDVSTHVQAKTNVKIAIDQRNGELSSVAYLPDWSTTLSHPDTHAQFAGQIVPKFTDACIQVETLHNKFPFISCIGWDISINQNEEIEIMEWNTGDNALNFHEAIHGPCFKDLLERSLAYRD